jgi:hypothetical protein
MGVNADDAHPMASSAGGFGRFELFFRALGLAFHPGNRHIEQDRKHREEQ